MKTIYILKGLPASGKSTWARDKLNESPGTYKRVNKDDLRAMLDDSHWSRHNEKFVLRLRDHIITEALRDGKHVIVDDTNLHPKHEARIEQIAHEYRKEAGEEIAVEVIAFNTDVEECIRRDLLRPRSVGEKVIRSMHGQFLAKPLEPLEQDAAKPWAIIVDIDGTLALHNGRDPYDASTCEQDRLYEPVARAVCHLASRYEIVLVSGRSDEYRPQTTRWLDKHDVPYKALFMRAAGDNRKDVIIKREIFEHAIEPTWYVDFVLDDRNQTVDGWREIGLACFQVAPGDF